MSKFDELNPEVIECARYGEDEDLRALLAYGADVNFCDESGNTALHKAAANGHVKCLEILKEFNANYTANKQGNYPIHWAAQNGQVEALRFLLNNFDVDVLAQNSFGMSTMSESFQSKNNECLELCLTHSSASDDRLIPESMKNSVKATIDEESEANEEKSTVSDGLDEKNAVFHDMNFEKSTPNAPTLKIRELPISRADTPFGTSAHPEDDTTGLGIWPASILTARFALLHKDLLQDKVVVELGAGCGLPAIAAAVYCQPAMVYLTDIHEATLINAAYNAKLNGSTTDISYATLPQYQDSFERFILEEVRVPHDKGLNNEEAVGSSSLLRVNVLNWMNPASFPSVGQVDVILGSDLVYDTEILAPLAFVVASLLKTGGSFLYLAPNEFRDGLDTLEVAMKEAGMLCSSKIPCPESMFANPLLGENCDDNYVLHFYDLPAKKSFNMYHFVKM